MRRLLSTRLNHWWRAFVLALGLYALAGLTLLLTVPDLAGVFLLGAYCIPANSIVPIPHEPAVLYFARYYEPVWIAAAATIGSIIASYADYALVGAAMRHRAFSRTRSSPLFQWAVRWMRRYPFALVVLFSFTPLPIMVVRILAPASEYPIRRYVVALLVGRFPRFWILAWIGHTFAIPAWALLALLVVLVLAVVASARGEPEGVADVDDEPELAAQSGTL